MESITQNTYQQWSNEEDSQLLEFYNKQKLEVIEISKKMTNRTIGNIISRLVKLNIITKRHEVRGYAIYKKSDAYAQAIIESKAREANGTAFSSSFEKKEEEDIDVAKEIRDLKAEIAGLRSVVNDLVKVIKDAYELADV